MDLKNIIVSAPHVCMSWLVHQMLWLGQSLQVWCVRLRQWGDSVASGLDAVHDVHDKMQFLSEAAGDNSKKE